MGIFGTSKLKLYAGDKKVKKAYLGSTKIYSAGNIVTYYVDSSTYYQEEVDSDASCLSPVTFTPSKSGWEFVGWREDTTASSGVLSSKIMGDEPVTLYAVFKQAVTLYYYNGSTTKQNKSDYRYYNNGNIVNPSFVMSQTTASGWTARGWATGTAGNASVAYSNGATITISADTTIYGLYQQTITLTYYNNSTTKQTKTGTRYWNSGSNAYVNPTFTLSQASKSGWTARGWATGTAGNASVAYSSINGTAFSANTTVYGLYYKTCTLTCKSYNKSEDKTGTAYYNSAGNTTNATTTTPTGATYSGWSWRGWSSGSVTTANASVAFANGATVDLGTDNHTIYGLYEQSVACNFISYNKTETKYATRYYNAYGNTLNGSVTAPTGASYSGWSWRGWSHNNGTGATLSPSYANGATVPDISTTENHYGLYEQAIYLYYNGNGSTSGSVSTQSGTRYWNAYGNYSNPSFKLASNGYSRTGYTFSKWDLGNAGATVTLSASTTAYAQWTDNAWTWVSGGKGSGESLVIYGSNLQNNGTTTFSPAGNNSEDGSDQSMSYYTNTVSTRGCKYITVEMSGYGNISANVGNQGADLFDMVYVADASGNKIKSCGFKQSAGWNAAQTAKIDISAYSGIQLRGHICNYDSYGAAVHVSTVSFSNS